MSDTDPTVNSPTPVPGADIGQDPGAHDPDRDEVDRVARLLMAAWEQAEAQAPTASYVATFADMARAVIADRPSLSPIAQPDSGSEIRSEIRSGIEPGIEPGAALDASMVATPGARQITVNRPAIFTGPAHLTVDEATSNYLRDAAIRVRTQRYWGSGVTALVSDLLDSVAEALDSSTVDTGEDAGRAPAPAARPSPAEVEEVTASWVEYGVRRTRGAVGTVANFERDERTAQRCARKWKGVLVSRLVTVSDWAPLPGVPSETCVAETATRP